MKKKIQILLFLSLILSFSFTSCVSSKKFAAAEAKNETYKKDSAYTQTQLNQCNMQVKNLNEEKVSLQNEKTSLQNERASLINENASAQSNLKTLSAESEMTIADQAERLKNFEKMVQSQKDVMDKLKNSISEALMKYKTDELSVYIKDGNVYVSLEEKLLFKSGSDVVDPKGKEALKSLAKVLNDTKDIDVLIEGHTDNIAINTILFKDNWDLSTARATAIVRILTEENGFDSNRITASGRGQFHPVKTNETFDGRAGNRRTEIILSPDLKELYTLMYQ